MNTAEQSQLGKATAYAGHYDPDLLFPIDRAPKRAELGLADALPFHGTDIWNAYELSWLDARGKPQVAMAELRVPATSPRLVESKSLKLYLNGFAGERLDADDLIARIRRDLATATGDEVDVQLVPAEDFANQELVTPAGKVIDGQDIAIDYYGPPRPELLQVDINAAPIDETLVSHLFKSNCPVTGQPDWASVQVHYTGAPIDNAGLLRYLVSFREHNAFHEQCVERIFTDILRRCAPERLSVYARFTRRGGLDINPWRSTDPNTRPTNERWARQ
ncbi:MAG TPA: NADPH-dependent 7-cyano-7-deazaguanine reductase QueF [Oleiagrimonas sp.]|nr:NADPH-dependent 7-cyano-7-deazaguanine reductase QueF [Oleiagrimonas sp.]